MAACAATGGESAVSAVEVVLGLLAVVVALAIIARRVNIPYPILFVLGGLALGLVPRLPQVVLSPNLVFLVFFPPLLYTAGLDTSLRDLRANARPIGSLAVGYVLASMAAVAAAAHVAIAGMPWAAAFVLGAIVSPPDPVAAIAVAGRLGVPQRVVTILEGEGLFNDATGLTAFRVALAATVSGAFSFGSAALTFVVASVGGVLIGLLVGIVAAWVQRRLDDPPVEILVSILTPFAAWIAAENIGLSGVMAVVTAGIYAERQVQPVISSTTRLRSSAVWDVLSFALEGLLFLLVGLQLPTITQALTPRPLGAVLQYAAIISLATILTRMVWSLGARWLTQVAAQALRLPVGPPEWRTIGVVSWAGMRGGDSLAAALAIPLLIHSGAPFPDRGLIVFLTFCVILVTLVGQGLTLPLVIRLLGLHDQGELEREEAAARRRVVAAGHSRLEEVADEPWAPAEAVRALRARYEHVAKHGVGPAAEADRRRHANERRLRLEVLAAERQEALRLRDAGAINDEVLQRIQHDLDIEEVRLGPED